MRGRKPERGKRAELELLNFLKQWEVENQKDEEEKLELLNLLKQWEVENQKEKESRARAPKPPKTMRGRKPERKGEQS